MLFFLFLYNSVNGTTISSATSLDEATGNEHDSFPISSHALLKNLSSLSLTLCFNQDLFLSHLEYNSCLLTMYPAPSVFPFIWVIFLKPTDVQSCHFHALIKCLLDQLVLGLWKAWNNMGKYLSYKTGCRMTIYYAIGIFFSNQLRKIH